MSIYQILAAMPDQQVAAIWQALAHQTTDYSEPYSTTYHPGVTGIARHHSGKFFFLLTISCTSDTILL